MSSSNPTLLADGAAAVPGASPATLITTTAEDWLSSNDFTLTTRSVYEKLIHGQGTSDRNIAQHIFVDTIIGLHKELLLKDSMIVDGNNAVIDYDTGNVTNCLNLLPLQQYLPEPDEEFIKNCCDTLHESTKLMEKNPQLHQGGINSNHEIEIFPTWFEMQKQGIADYEQFLEMIQAVFVQIAHCAELLQQQLMQSDFGKLSRKLNGGLIDPGTIVADVLNNAGSAGQGGLAATSLLRHPSVHGVQGRNC